MSKTASLPNELYFVTLTIVDWISIFIRQKYFTFIVENLEYCQEKKNLEIFEYVIMPNHIHMICRGRDVPLSDILRDFKSYTSKELYKMVKSDAEESRKEWMIKAFLKHGKENKLNQDFQVWQNFNSPTLLYDNQIIDQKTEYIRNNPVRAGFVVEPEHYKHSSASPDSPINTLEF